MATAMSIVKSAPLLRVCVLEKEAQLAAHQTGHNSGVIHSGIYYRPGSVKARTCVRGRDRLVRFCEERGINHEICGKVIVASSKLDLCKLEELLARSAANGVPGVVKLSPEQMIEIEPAVSGVGALYVPSTGIVNYVDVTAEYGRIFQCSGGQLKFSSRVTRIVRGPEGLVLEAGNHSFFCRCAVNCAGLYSDEIARLSGESANLRIVPFRGEYYRLAPERKSLVRNLIYPVPDPRLPFLGVHFTRRVDCSIEAGPNAVLAFRREGYHKLSFSPAEFASMVSFPGFWKMSAQWWRTGVDEMARSFLKSRFVKALQKLVPDVRSSDLQPGGSGVRAQAVSRDGHLLDDFHIVKGNRMIHVCNVPSPAATASLEIGDTVAAIALSTFAEHLPSFSLPSVSAQ